MWEARCIRGGGDCLPGGLGEVSYSPLPRGAPPCTSEARPPLAPCRGRSVAEGKRRCEESCVRSSMRRGCGGLFLGARGGGLQPPPSRSTPNSSRSTPEAIAQHPAAERREAEGHSPGSLETEHGPPPGPSEEWYVSTGSRRYGPPPGASPGRAPAGSSRPRSDGRPSARRQRRG